MCEFEPDVTSEVSPDVKPDVTSEATPDVKPDVTPDASPDVKPDVTADASPDVKPDVAPDASPDVTSVASPDVKPDVTSEASPDVRSNIHVILNFRLCTYTWNISKIHKVRRIRCYIREVPNVTPNFHAGTQVVCYFASRMSPLRLSSNRGFLAFSQVRIIDIRPSIGYQTGFFGPKTQNAILDE